MPETKRACDIPLTAHEVEQLLALHEHGMTGPGHLIMKPAEKSLREKGLTGRTEDGCWCVVNRAGVEWLLAAGLIPQED